MFKLLLSGLIALGLLGSNCNAQKTSDPVTNATPIFITPDAALGAPANPHLFGIRLMVCKDKNAQYWVGTMFHYADRKYITANHVAGNDAQCFDAETSTPVKLIHGDSINDFAIVETPKNLDNVYFEISCEPFISGNTYQSLGWAGGTVLLQKGIKASWVYTDKNFKVEGMVNYHLRKFKGLIISGMSGGPIVDENWVVHGINNVSDTDYDLSWSRELSDTVLCNK